MAIDKSIEARIAEKAAELGFAACGFARADAAPRAGERLRQWLVEGCHGSMIWMEGRAEQRASPAGLWPEVKSVIALGMSYAPAVDPLALEGAADRGRISVYAQGADYHDVVKKALKALGRWLVAEAGGELKVFVDTAPVMEKPLAEAAGLGWQGKHTNLVSREHGSWLFLGAIYTTLELAGEGAGGDRCGSCDACQRACPTDAFPAPYRLDARRCISYWTIEHAGPVPDEIADAMGNRIYGCDDCLAVCPWNKFAAAAARRTGCALACRTAGARRCRVPAGVRWLADQADRAGADGAQRADRGGEWRGCVAAAGGDGPAGGRGRDGARRGGEGGGAVEPS